MSASAIFLENLLNALTAGILVGCLYGLMCVGLGMVFGIMRVVNFAQAELLMLGMFAALLFYSQTGLTVSLGAYAGPIVAAFLAGPVLLVFGALIYQLLISRVSGLKSFGSRQEGHIGQFIMTLGISLILQNGGQLVFGSTPQTVRTPLSSSAWSFEIYADGPMVFLNQARVAAALVAIAVAIGLFLLLEYTRTGRALRGAANNPVAATYVGIDVNRAYLVAFAIGSAVTGICGGLMAPSISFTTFTGIDFVIIMYAGVTLGGLGSILGAFWGGMTIGLVQQLSSLVLPAQLQNASIFAVFLLIVLFRPQGFFGRVAERA